MNNNIALEVSAFKLAATLLSLDTELHGRTEPAEQIYNIKISKYAQVHSTSPQLQTKLIRTHMPPNHSAESLLGVPKFHDMLLT